MTLKTYTSGYWEECEHESWAELQKDGWTLHQLVIESKEPVAIMTRNGCINTFKEVLE